MVNLDIWDFFSDPNFQLNTNQSPSSDLNELENVVKILVDGLTRGTLVEMTLFMLIFVAIG